MSPGFVGWSALVRARALFVIVACALLATLFALLPSARPASGQSAPPVDVTILDAEMRSREAQLVALVNRERRSAGLLPVRWNRDLSEAAAWLARDTTEAAQFVCDDEDSLGRRTGERIRAFGYTKPTLFRQLIVCGFTEPVAAVAAWAYGGDTRAALLQADAREAGAGYYYSPEKQRGFVVLVLSRDESFAPALLDDEAVSTADAQVRLTLHTPAASQPAPTQMKIANEPNFDRVAWTPFAAETNWTLRGGTGWRTVYVLTQNILGETTFLTDTIYLGASAPKTQISLDQATNIGSALAITEIPAVSATAVRLSMGWKVDDPAFSVYRGPQLPLADADAAGGSALMLVGDESEGLARAESGALPLNRVLTAYVRLKVADNSGNGEVARIVVKADGQSFGPLRLKASDFAAPGVYQEFGLNFAFPAAPQSALAEVEVYRIGLVDLTLDVVRFFGQPLSTQAPIVWSAGSSNVRNRGVWLRAEDTGTLYDASFTPVDNATQLPGQYPHLAPSPERVVFTASSSGEVTPANAAIVVCGLWCDSIDWQASSNAPWLALTPSPEGVILTANATGLSKGIYYGVVTITPGVGSAATPATAAVELWVDGAQPPTDTEIVSRIYLPMTMQP